MVWGCISDHGMSDWHSYEVTINEEVYSTAEICTELKSFLGRLSVSAQQITELCFCFIEKQNKTNPNFYRNGVFQKEKVEYINYDCYGCWFLN